MKVAKQAVSYYHTVTGNPWSDFYDKLDTAMSGDLETQNDDMWLIHSLMNEVIKHGMSLNEFKINKDAVKAVFDEDSRKQNGEFFTPEVWAVEARKYFDKYIPNWHEYNVWETSCYSMDTEIFTKRGWVTYDELLDDDEIYTLNPISLKAEWSTFYNRFKKPYIGKVVHFNGDNIDLLVTEDHMMFCGHRKNHNQDGEFVSISAKDLVNFYKDKASTYKPYYIITSAEPADKVSSNVFMDFSSVYFWKFIGFYIGDGGFYKDNNGNINAIKFHLSKERKINYLNELLHGLGLSSSVYDYRDLADGEVAYRITEPRLLDFITKNVGWGTFNKNIDVFSLDYDARNALLDGLVNSDGYYRGETIYKFDTFDYYTANKDLATTVANLAYLVGRNAYITNRVRENGSVEYRVHFKALQKATISPLNIEVLDYNDFVWDLTTSNNNHIFLVKRKGKVGFSKNCGSGNLVRSMGHNPDKLFMSTLQEDDVRMVQNTPEFAGANVFQCDFLSGIDYDEYNTQFLDKLPEKLQQIIKNDEPLIIFSNPPYKTGMASATEVGRFMKESSTPEIDMSKPAYDMFYQFCWRYMKFVEMFNLTNCYCGFFGPLTFFTGAGANILLSEFEHYYDFVDGMCISAQEFSDTSDSIIWGIGFSLWKSTGSDYNSFNRKDILLEKKYLLPDGSVGSKGRVLYEPPREKLSDWVAPKDVNMDITAPLATSHLTFKGSEVFEKVAPKSGKMASNALGTLMIGNTLTRSADQSAILSVPSTIMYTSITEENFWRCVASYAFRRIYDASWAVTKKEISAPNTNVEGYQQWLYNAIPLVLFEYKSMMASMRDVVWEGAKTDIRNHLFYLDEATVRQYCHDPVILEDLEKNPPCNQFMLNIIEQTKPYWAPEVKQLYDWCVNYTLATYDMRKSVNYKGSLECWDAGFQQIRSGCWDDKLNDELTKILVTARDFMKRDVDKFGFVSDADGEDL